jgi:GGDEF domain-containing protein
MIWLIVFFNVKDLFNLFENNTGAFIAVLVVSVLIILIPVTIKLPGWIIVLMPTIIFLLMNIGKGGFDSITATSITLSESISIIVTLLLAYWVNVSLHQLSGDALKGKGNIPTQETNGLGYIYREVRRSRNHNNPLAILAIEIEFKNQNFIYKKFRNISKLSKYKENVLSGVGNILINELEDIAIIVQGDDHFLVALPETRPEDIPFITDRIQKQVNQQLNERLLFGSATLPKDGYTFEGLIEKATMEMNGNLATQYFGNLKRKASEHPIVANE